MPISPGPSVLLSKVFPARAILHQRSRSPIGLHYALDPARAFRHAVPSARNGLLPMGDSMFGLSREQLLGFLRHVITFVGGIFVARGKLDPVAVDSIGGAIITLVGLFFSSSAPEKQVAPPQPVPEQGKTT